MSEKRKTDFTLNRLDDLFTSQSERENGLTPTIKDIPLEKLVPFPNHPFKVRDDEEMNKLVESVSENGVLVPAIVREKDNGDYEIVSGHRRKFASEIAGKITLRCIVSNLDDDAATVIMVDSNIQRENILPSEKAFAYKMKLDAMNRQGKRTDLTFSQNGKKLNSANLLAEDTGESKTQIYRYISLTKLIPELLQMVDELVQLLRGGKQHLDQHAVIAGHTVALHNVAAALDVGVKLRLALGIHVQIDERLDHVAQLRRVDLCLVAGDGAGAFQPGHAGRHGGAGQKHMVGNFF